MEQVQSGGFVASFISQLRSNGLYLLMVLIATGALLYFIVGMFKVLGH
ncbi:MAG: hypothetical protein WC053_01250 [Sideroxydans sp.]|jgi:hypothetical protein